MRALYIPCKGAGVDLAGLSENSAAVFTVRGQKKVNKFNFDSYCKLLYRGGGTGEEDYCALNARSGVRVLCTPFRTRAPAGMKDESPGSFETGPVKVDATPGYRNALFLMSVGESLGTLSRVELQKDTYN
ncbi:hypothetical protein JZ751_024233 [Albula glossodonta]|uniref:Uncharacterized protein n=1 Tax=Albula glossodonta TaxID=121402 RepID=A0A8T2NN99_9TELE|nr:hypothetical protein JZ751_024233 [Albula glossodonta]